MRCLLGAALWLVAASGSSGCGAFADTVAEPDGGPGLRFTPDEFIRQGERKPIRVEISRPPPWGTNPQAMLTQLDFGPGLGFSRADFSGADNSLEVVLQAQPDAEVDRHTVRLTISLRHQTYSAWGFFWVFSRSPPGDGGDGGPDADAGADGGPDGGAGGDLIAE
jgi:hypothetical protein